MNKFADFVKASNLLLMFFRLLLICAGIVNNLRMKGIVRFLMLD